jgi:hypothetical protein
MEEGPSRPQCARRSSFGTLLAEVGIAVKTIPGPDYWLLPSGRSMYEESKLVEQ